MVCRIGVPCSLVKLVQTCILPQSFTLKTLELTKRLHGANQENGIVDTILHSKVSMNR